MRALPFCSIVAGYAAVIYKAPLAGTLLVACHFLIMGGTLLLRPRGAKTKCTP